MRAAFASLRKKGGEFSTTTETTQNPPFSVEISQQQIDNLRRHVEATRWPTPEVVDASQEFRVADLQELRAVLGRGFDFGGSSSG